jgi:hypothetical protein
MTQLYLKLLQDHLQSNKDHLEGFVLNTRALSQKDIQVLAQLKGQILTLQEISDISEFITDEDLESLN